jgi:penicillin-binding protein 1C
VLTDILADDAARAAAFGRGSVLELPFAVAAKTGTSKGYRDNWTVGFTHEVTVAVWAGNFDGTPMIGSSGITGAAPLFHDVMLAAMRGREPAPLVDRTGLVEIEVCALSGARPGPGCTHRVRELFRPEQAPRDECTMHVRALVDRDDGLLASPSCSNAEERSFESYEPRYLPWAKAAARPLIPERYSPRCPGHTAPLAGGEGSTPVVRYPRDGARFVVDPGGPSRQEIVLAAAPASNGGAVRFVLDGRTLGTVGAPYELPWMLAPGRHRLDVASATTPEVGGVTFEVEDGR